MGKATLAKQRAIGLVGLARTDKLYDAGLVVLFAEEYERLRARVAELERANKLLSDSRVDAGTVAAQILQEAMGR